MLPARFPISIDTSTVCLFHRASLSSECTLGHYCPVGSAAPINCLAGTFQNDTGASECDLCPAGYYCESGAAVALACLAGNYCPEASEFGSQFPCPNGMYSEETGLAASNECYLCAPGRYENALQTSGRVRQRPKTLTFCMSEVVLKLAVYIAMPFFRGQAKRIVTCMPASRFGWGRGEVHSRRNRCNRWKQRNEMLLYYQRRYMTAPWILYREVKPPLPFSDWFLNMHRFCGSEGLTEPEGLCGPGFYCALGAKSPMPSGNVDSTVGGMCAAGYACVEVNVTLSGKKKLLRHARTRVMKNMLTATSARRLLVGKQNSSENAPCSPQRCARKVLYTMSFFSVCHDTPVGVWCSLGVQCMSM